MHLHTALTVCLAATTAFAADPLDPSSYAPEDILTRDVAIVGGGSSGTYAAVRLRDHGKSVVVIDHADQLGGHAQTYIDPVTGTPIDIGVIIFSNSSIVRNYFARFDIPLFAINGAPPPARYVDFASGEIAKNFQPPNDTAVGEALEAYAAQLAKYPSLATSFNTTYPLAPDLLLPFGDFVKKYNLGGMMYPMFLICQGASPLLNITTIYMIKYLNELTIKSLQTGFLTPPSTHVLYVAAGKFLGASNVFLESSVVAMDRASTPMKICISTPSGQKLILAKRLLSAIPPLLSNLGGFDLDSTERGLFGEFFANGYYTGLLNNTGIVTETLGLDDAVASNPYGIPSEPGIYGLNLVPNTTLTHVYFGTVRPISGDDVKGQIQMALNQYRTKNNMPPKQDDWAIFRAHVPFNLQVSTEALENRFYEKVYALNGHRNTFWTGAAFQTQASDVIWQYDEEYIVPIVLGSLGG